MGLDRGVYNIVTTSEGVHYGAKDVRRVKRKYNHVRSGLQEKYTEPVSQRGLNYKRCSIDGNLDSTESGAGGYASAFVKNDLCESVTSLEKLHKLLVIEVSCGASRCAA